MMPHYHEALVLKAIRLEEGWSYDALALQIGGLNASTLHRFIERPGEYVPLETTLYKIRRFLATRRTRARRRQRRRPAAERQVSL